MKFITINRANARVQIFNNDNDYKEREMQKEQISYKKQKIGDCLVFG
ncbi:MAG: hypothetical protein ABH971_02560 [bacterium]